eukprot:TRINITY_DN2850_c0_g1_i1.p1 TRINITY_DN2850_c0_g1~~TRINITY_DN2850_c0_g1_i1.p1  ORF type:complete len:251 (-),score=79.01 TRINITY_DN2850_c0_g1_i1:137-889(-)
MSETEVLKKRIEELKEQNASYKLALGKCGEREFHLQNQIASLLKEQAKPTKSAREMELEVQVAQLLKEKKDAREKIRLAKDGEILASNPDGVFDYLQEDINSDRDDDGTLVTDCSNAIIKKILMEDVEPYEETQYFNGEAIMFHFEEFLNRAKEFEGDRGLGLCIAIMDSFNNIYYCSEYHREDDFDNDGDYDGNKIEKMIDEAALTILRENKSNISLNVLEYIADEFPGQAQELAATLLEEPEKKTAKC